MIYYLVVFYPDGEIRDINSYDSEEAREEALDYYKNYFLHQGFIYKTHQEIR